MSNTAYLEFIKKKHVRIEPKGFELELEALKPESFGDRHQFQPYIVQWALKLGSAAIFASYGMGKARMLLEWAKQVSVHTGKKVLILSPLAVSHQTVREGKKFGIDAEHCLTQDEASKSDYMLIATNYERLEQFDAAEFGGVALDEAAILKAYSGKIKNLLIAKFANTKFKLCLSALPAPNDHLELLNQAVFLGVGESHKIISKFFTNDTMNAGKYALRPFAAKAFWEWVASWAVCLTMPSDMGFSDDGWILPGSQLRYHTVAVDHSKTFGDTDRDGQLTLVRSASLSATNVHREQRLNVDAIALKIAEINSWYGADESIPIWCFTNYESEAIAAAIPDAVELKGSELALKKEEKLAAFSDGQIKRLITKPEIAGLGLNWQHAANQIFCMGTSYSFEQFHQALHRLLRFGQQRIVTSHLVYPETTGSVRAVMTRKQDQFIQMQSELRDATKAVQMQVHNRFVDDDYNPQVKMTIPNWLTAKAG